MNATLLSPSRLLRDPVSALPYDMMEPLTDTLGRSLTDLRLSVTDRCNFRCTYCMPRDKLGPVVPATQKEHVLDFETLTTIARAFVELGVKKLRLTGGEPLVRRDLPRLVEKLSELGIDDLCMTTNGSLLSAQAAALASAGLGRVTVSLDAIDEATFRKMTDGHTPLSKILAGIDAARHSGLEPVKINMVVQRGKNDHAVRPMAAWARSEGLELRFIEYMDVGCSNGWRSGEVVTGDEIRAAIHALFPLESVEHQGTETADRYRYLDGRGYIGIVASVTRPFCGGCTRARISSRGEFYSCLFAPVGLDLTRVLERGEPLAPLISATWRRRDDRYSELRAWQSNVPSRRLGPEMFAIGG
jgi:cyclic pyranopterin phosphate synthase